VKLSFLLLSPQVSTEELTLKSISEKTKIETDVLKYTSFEVPHLVKVK